MSDHESIFEENDVAMEKEEVDSFFEEHFPDMQRTDEKEYQPLSKNAVLFDKSGKDVVGGRFDDVSAFLSDNPNDLKGILGSGLEIDKAAISRDLSHGDFRNTKISNSRVSSRFDNSKVGGMVFEDCDDLSLSSFAGCDMRGVVFRNCDVSGMDLRGAKNVDKIQFENCDGFGQIEFEGD